MIIEVLAVKGFAAICTFVAHHAVATKVVFTGYKLLKAYSLAQIATGGSNSKCSDWWSCMGH